MMLNFMLCACLGMQADARVNLKIPSARRLTEQTREIDISGNPKEFRGVPRSMCPFSILLSKVDYDKVESITKVIVYENEILNWLLGTFDKRIYKN